MTRSDLEEAKAALLKFDWVIFQDTLNDSLERLNKDHGWELTMPKTKERVRVNKPGWTQHPVLLEHLRETNALDIELFTWAKEVEVARGE